MITGIIESKRLGKAGEGAYGPWQVYEFMVDGTRYSTFKKDIYDKFAVGQTVTMDGEETAKGWNMKSMVLADKAEVVKVPGEVKSKENGSMYASYAKDIFCELCKRPEELAPTKIMEVSINLVKQAKEAFE